MTSLLLFAFWTKFKFVLCIILAILWGGIMGLGTIYYTERKDKSKQDS